MNQAVLQPSWSLTYTPQTGAGANITSDVTTYVTTIRFRDILEHAASEIEIRMEDRDHFWQGPWLPQRGDTLGLSIGYVGQSLLPCGLFTIDSVVLDGPPDVVTMKAVSASITLDMRSRRSAHYENVTLRQIVEQIAQKYNLQLINSPPTYGLVSTRVFVEHDPTLEAALKATQTRIATGKVQIGQDIVLRRVTQKNETDLHFLRRMANLYNYVFTIRGQQMVFMSRPSFELFAPVGVLRKPNLTKFKFTNKTHDVYRSAQVSYFLPEMKDPINVVVAADPLPPVGAVLNLPIRAESQQDATQKALAALYGHNMHQRTARVTAFGDPALLSGNNWVFDGFATFDGTYLIEGAEHVMQRRTGYNVELDMRRTVLQ